MLLGADIMLMTGVWSMKMHCRLFSLNIILHMAMLSLLDVSRSKQLWHDLGPSERKLAPRTLKACEAMVSIYV